MGPPAAQSPDGFTEFPPNPDTTIIYVSSSTGDDANDGLSEATPLRSARAGLRKLRNGYPDHLLFKRGDVWQESFGGWTVTGRSAAEPMVIGAYGQGDRPRFDFSESMILRHGGTDGPLNTDNLAFVSLHFNGTDHDVSKGNMGPTKAPACINWLRPAVNVLFEDMRFQYCGVVVQAELPGTVAGWRFYRSQFLDSYASDGEHQECVYFFGVSAFAIEESMFDLCGWHPDVPAAVPTIYNHAIYWQKDGPTDGLVRGNIIMRGASHGVQMRSSGKVLDNVFARNAIQGFLSDDVAAGAKVYGETIGNVFIESEDTLPRQGHPAEGNSAVPRGWGWELLCKYPDSTRFVMKNNIFSHCNATGSCQTVPAQLGYAEIADNIIWDWKSSLPADLKESAGPFKDPDRTLASYNASLGGDESFEGFAQQVRRQSKANWRTEYTAAAVIAYIRDGFEPAP